MSGSSFNRRPVWKILYALIYLSNLLYVSAYNTCYPDVFHIFKHILLENYILENIMDGNLSLAETLKQARRARGLTQAELGARVGIPQSHISKIEKDRKSTRLNSSH